MGPNRLKQSVLTARQQPNSKNEGKCLAVFELRRSVLDCLLSVSLLHDTDRQTHRPCLSGQNGKTEARQTETMDNGRRVIRGVILSPHRAREATRADSLPRIHGRMSAACFRAVGGLGDWWKSATSALSVTIPATSPGPISRNAALCLHSRHRALRVANPIH